MEVWPDNAMVVAAFIAMGTQWRTGNSGPTGLDYSALPVVMQMLKIPESDQSEVFDGVYKMEDAALEKMYSK